MFPQYIILTTHISMALLLRFITGQTLADALHRAINANKAQVTKWLEAGSIPLYAYLSACQALDHEYISKVCLNLEERRPTVTAESVDHFMKIESLKHEFMNWLAQNTKSRCVVEYTNMPRPGETVPFEEVETLVHQFFIQQLLK